MAFKWNWELIKYEVQNRTSVITMNRPEKRNALSPQLVRELSEAFTRAENDRKVRVVVLTGEGKAFSAGADLQYIQQMQEASYEDNLADSLRLMELFKLIYTLNKPVIAALNGHAIAGGCGLATVCDFIFSVPEAKLGYTEVRIGFIPAIVSTFLIRRIGEGKARELLLTGKLITAEEALKINLINRIIPSDKLLNETLEFAQELAETTSGEAISRTKWLIANIYNFPFPQNLEFAAEQNAKARQTRDCQIGISRFLKKEEQKW